MTYDLKFTLLRERASTPRLLIRALQRQLEVFRGTQRENSSKPPKPSIVERSLVFKR